MCVDGIAPIAKLNPGDKKTATRRCRAPDQPVAGMLWIRHLVSLCVRHDLLDFGRGDRSLWVVLLDVLPIGSVPHDRPIVHSHQYIPTGYTLGKWVASGI